MATLRSEWTGLPYDGAFAWDAERLYCIELVHKLYHRGAGVRLGQLRPIGDFALDHPDVRAAARARFGGRVPVDQLVLSPADLYADPQLVEVP